MARNTYALRRLRLKAEVRGCLSAAGVGRVKNAVYWLASIAALALVIWDIVDKGAHYTSIVVLGLVVIATVALRAPSR